MPERPALPCADCRHEGEIVETLKWLAFYRGWLAGWAKARGNNLNDPANLTQLAWEDFQGVDVEGWATTTEGGSQ